MSERGLILALQRFHDDPGFARLVAQDAQSTLGLYDLDDNERQELLQAVTSRNESAMRGLASRCGMDWSADHITGVGALTDEEISTEGAVHRGIEHPGAFAGDGYAGVEPMRPAGT